MIKKNQYTTIALGGTFDHFHDGHRDFITFAAELAKFLVIGVTDEKMVLQKSFPLQIQPLYQRKQSVSQYCAQENIQAKVITIHDQFGPTIEDNKIQAIACTTDTVSGAEKINEIREGLHLKELPVHIHNLVLDSEKQAPISSHRIRAGEINRDGLVYASLFPQDLKLSAKMRDFFSTTHGEVLSELPKENNSSIKIIVGDSSLEKFITQKWKYDLGIFDYKQKRKITNNPTIKKITDFETISNPAGSITSSAVQSLSDWFKEPDSFKHLFVEGEEDLLAVVTVLLAPLGTYVYYGQPDIGIVETQVTEQLKQSFLENLYPNLSRK